MDIRREEELEKLFLEIRDLLRAHSCSYVESYVLIDNFRKIIEKQEKTIDNIFSPGWLERGKDEYVGDLE